MADYVRERAGPDAHFLADYETAMVLLAREKPLRLNGLTEETKAEGSRVVAMLFLSTSDDPADGAKLEETLSPMLISALEKHAQGQVAGLISALPRHTSI